jgi:hypothetical protein
MKNVSNAKQPIQKDSKRSHEEGKILQDVFGFGVFLL